MTAFSRSCSYHVGTFAGWAGWSQEFVKVGKSLQKCILISYKIKENLYYRSLQQRLLFYDEKVDAKLGSQLFNDSFFWAPMSLRLHLLSCQLHVGNLVSTQLYFTEYSNPSLRECTAKASPNTSIISSHLHPTSTQTKLSVVFSLHCVELSLECKREAVFSSGSLP